MGRGELLSEDTPSMVKIFHLVVVSFGLNTSVLSILEQIETCVLAVCVCDPWSEHLQEDNHVLLYIQ